VLCTKTLVAFSDLNSSVLLPVAHTYIGTTNNRLMLIKWKVYKISKEMETSHLFC
jgi:hypothetical protein